MFSKDNKYIKKFNKGLIKQDELTKIEELRYHIKLHYEKKFKGKKENIIIEEIANEKLAIKKKIGQFESSDFKDNTAVYIAIIVAVFSVALDKILDSGQIISVPTPISIGGWAILEIAVLSGLYWLYCKKSKGLDFTYNVSLKVLDEMEKQIKSSENSNKAINQIKEEVAVTLSHVEEAIDKNDKTLKYFKDINNNNK